MYLVCKCDECAGITKYNIIYEHHRVTNNYHCDILQWAWYAQHSTIMIHNPTKGINQESMWNKYHIITINKTHSTNSTKWSNPCSNTYIAKHNQQLKNPRNQGYNHEELRENKKTHTFSWRLKLRWWRKMEVFRERTRWVCERDEWTRQWTFKNVRGKTEKF